MRNKSYTIAITFIVFVMCVLFSFMLVGCCNTDDGSIMVSSSVDGQNGEVLATPSPVNLDMTSDQRKITLTWDKSKNANGYAIYFSEDGSNYEHLISTNRLSYQTEELTPGDLYYFRIKPYNSKTGSKTVYGEPTDKSIVCVDSQEIDGYEVGDTYVHIDIDQQTMWFYKNNKLIVETPIVSGTEGVYDTPTGYFEVRTMAAPAHLVGPTWDVYTEYWVGISQSNDIGLHDSLWRETGYGGDIYTYNGSNGCINTPLDAMKKIYENITIGTPVIISGSRDVSYTGSYDYSLETTPDTIMATDDVEATDTSDYSDDSDDGDSSDSYDDNDDYDTTSSGYYDDSYYPTDSYDYDDTYE